VSPEFPGALVVWLRWSSLKVSNFDEGGGRGKAPSKFESWVGREKHLQK